MSSQRVLEQSNVTNKRTPGYPPSPVEQGPAVNPIFRAIWRIKPIRNEALIGSLRGLSKLLKGVRVPAELDDVLNVVADRLNKLEDINMFINSFIEPVNLALKQLWNF